MKKVLSFVLVFTLIFAYTAVAVPVSAAESSDYEYKVNDDGNTVTIKNYYGKATELVIPSTIDGYEVTAIGDFAFRKCDSLVNITIPASVEDIGLCAFNACVSLTSIEVDKNNSFFSSIDGVLFNKEQTKLIQYPIGNSRISYTVPDTVKTIENSSFEFSILESITIPNGVQNILFDAFSHCESLKGITIPDSVKIISIGAFSYCGSLKSITIPDSVTSIGSQAFYMCSSLESITVDTDNIYYSSQEGVLFNNDKTELIQYPIGNSRTAYSVPGGVESIGDCAFTKNNNLTSVTIPDSVTGIEPSAFSECSNLKSITIPDSVTLIGHGAFSKCSSLESITIPDSVTLIEYSAFSKCSSLTSITIPDSVKGISDGAFEDCSSLKSITIPDSSDRIGSFAFAGCGSLTNITIPDSVTVIGMYAFSGCENLTSITIPSGVEKIGYDALWGCDNLTIYGYSGSQAENYAQKYGIEFVALGEADDKPAGTEIGDTNGDGKVTIADATQIQKHLANILKLEGAELEAADTNGDGKVTIADATQIQKYLANIISSLG